MKRLASERRATTALEVAICLPVLLLLIFAFIEFGRLLVMQHSMEWTTIRTLRYAAVHSSASGAADDVPSLVTLWTATMPPVVAGTCTVTPSFSPANTVGGTITIATSCPWTPLTTMLGLNPITVASTLSAPILY